MPCSSNACKQGRSRCPTPTACEVPEPDEWAWIDSLIDKAYWPALGIAFMVTLAFAAGYFSGSP
jgi:hypothetical protein